MRAWMYLLGLAVLCVQFEHASAQAPVKRQSASNPAIERARAEKEAQATAEVKATIDSMLALIEMGDIATLIARYLYPPDVEEALSEQVTFDVLVQRFKTRGAERLKAALKEARAQKPNWNSELDKAHFEQEGKDVIFVRYKGQWYLRN